MWNLNDEWLLRNCAVCHGNRTCFQCLGVLWAYVKPGIIAMAVFAMRFDVSLVTRQRDLAMGYAQQAFRAIASCASNGCQDCKRACLIMRCRVSEDNGPKGA